MFNRLGQLRSVKADGGGHRLAIAVLAATEGGAFYRPERRVQPGIAAVPCKKRAARRPDPQLNLRFAMSEDDLAAEFERMFR